MIKYNMLTLKDNSLVLFIFAFFIVVKFTGGLLPVSMTALLGVIVLIATARLFYPKESHSKNKNIYILLYVSLLLLILGSLAWTNGFDYGSSKVIILFSIIITITLIYDTLLRKYDLFIKYFAIIYVITVIYIFIYQSGAFIKLLLGESLYRYRIVEGLNSNVISVFFALGVLSFLQLFITEKRKITKLIAVFFGVISLVLLFITGSRGCLIALFGGAFVFYLIVFVKDKKKIFLTVFSFIFLIILFNSNILRFFSDFMPESMANFFEDRYLSINAIESVNARKDLFSLAIENYFSESFFNWIFGNGAGSYGFLLNGHDAMGYPHNIILELLYEFGLMSVLIFLIITYKIVMDNYKYVNKHNLVKGNWEYLYFYFVFINSLSTGDVAANFLVFGYMVLLINKNNTIEQ